MSEEKDISDTIIWLAQQRIKTEKYQNINSAIHGVHMVIIQHLMDFMDKHKGDK